jgi:carbonic anhydrase
MNELERLFENNKVWASDKLQVDPEFFHKLVAQQAPKYLWIGCADSRVPANEIVGLLPGELFVHRNIANLFQNNDLNALSVLQYAVDVLKVEHVFVTGHYGCGGVAAALSNKTAGLVDNWLRTIKDLYIQNRTELDLLDFESRVARLCEINVIRQALNIAHSTVVQEAWKNGQELKIHSWIYDIQDGLLKDLQWSMHDSNDTHDIYR